MRQWLIPIGGHRRAPSSIRRAHARHRVFSRTCNAYHHSTWVMNLSSSGGPFDVLTMLGFIVGSCRMLRSGESLLRPRSSVCSTLIRSGRRPGTMMIRLRGARRDVSAVPTVWTRYAEIYLVAGVAFFWGFLLLFFGRFMRSHALSHPSVLDHPCGWSVRATVDTHHGCHSS